MLLEIVTQRRVRMNKVVVIDDNSQVRDRIKNIILKAGYIVFDAPNGKIGLKLVKNKNPNLVVTDIVMPEQDGLEVISNVQRDYPETKIIAISGGSRKLGNLPILELALKIGADFIFDKPVNEKKFLDVINQIFVGAF